MAEAIAKQIRIKTGVVKRLAKEKQSYVKEVEKEKTKLEKMKADGGDSYLIRKQEEVISEAMMMIPDTAKRFRVAYNELQDIIDNEPSMLESEEYQAALVILKDTKEADSF